MCPRIWRFQKYIKRKTRDNAQFILQEASPNALHEINSPLPRLIDISRTPCRGVDIRQVRAFTLFTLRA